MTSDILASNYFELFDCPVAYDIDLNKIQNSYRELQKAVHPDRFASAGAQERRLSMQQTSRINEAFQTLKHPVQRAVYMLKLKGIDMDFESQTTMDDAFLMQQMELREELDEVDNKKDPLAELDKLAADIRQDMDQRTREFIEAYEQNRLEDAKELIRKLQFLQKAQNQIEQKSAAIEDELL